MGAAIIIAGHLTMLAIPYSHTYLYIALSLIAAGSALFRVNCATLLGEFYHKDDPKLRAGFTIYYAALNLGAFIAMILCGFVAQSFGWGYGFSLAGFGMIFGLCLFIAGRKWLEDKGLHKAQARHRYSMGIYLVLLTPPLAYLMIIYSHISMQLLPVMILGILLVIAVKSFAVHKNQKMNIALILLATLLLSLFYASEELIGSSMVLFAERVVNREFFGMILPSSTLNSVNPITIIIMGFILSRYLTTHGDANRVYKLHAFRSISYAFLIMSLGFIFVLFGNLFSLMMSFALIAVAELFIGPVVYTLCTRLAPDSMRGQSMGIVMLGYSLAGLMSGYLGKYLMVDEAGVNTFYSGFTTVGICTAAIGILVFLSVRVAQMKN